MLVHGRGPQERGDAIDPPGGWWDAPAARDLNLSH